LPPVEFGRIATQAAKQVIVQRVREAERERQYEEFKDRVGEIISGVVKRVEYGNVVLDLGRSEAVVRRDNLIPREVFRPGDRIRAYIQNVRREQRGPQVILSRTDPALWPNCSCKKCRRFMMALSKCAPWPVTRAAVPKSV
jgi:N utilization substance protein A